MPNFCAQVLKVPSVYVLDDGGVPIRSSRKRGINVRRRDRVEPKQADFSPVLAKIKASGAASLYYPQAGIKGRVRAKLRCLFYNGTL
jgi:hypothetical protein